MADSLPLAREKPEPVFYEETWPSLLKKKGHEVLQICIGGATSNDLLRQVSYHKNFLPDVVIVQVGIVDCAPRHFTQFEILLLRKIPFFGKIALRFFNKPYIRKIRQISYVSPDRFRQNLIDIQTNFNGIKMLFIGIIPADGKYEKILPGINKSINKYNQILIELFGDKFIDMSCLPENSIMSDFHHLNKVGHKALVEKIIEKVDILS
ncbi:MAG: SGNH/GDSL hydrolase family protein [Bacteroidia bacterium]